MPTLESIQTKIKRLQEQAETLKARQATATLDRIVGLMKKSGVTVADIEAYVGGKKGGAKAGRKAVARTAAAAVKYQNPKTGATWSGRGRAPAWIASAKNRDRFLVDGGAVSSSPAPSTKSGTKRSGNYVKGQQPAKYADPKSGATWSGRGRAPAWLAAAKDRTKFLIEGQA
ncbi:H-NS family nucleoid-associated regulatory protein [Trinickia dinghuensis]|uniref:H-NS histone family protein n=1 Tax=Trinickia dinghuensis TaxID=2291023 RepID=A0A3D8JWR2_9BURK|nr:H-NS family nucleoid-associated regulatory protein [Trinickia dinghuensis]RDU97499.1 H-NS histone family protein [Trinickia dinghuensis]